MKNKYLFIFFGIWLVVGLGYANKYSFVYYDVDKNAYISDNLSIVNSSSAYMEIIINASYNITELNISFINTSYAFTSIYTNLSANSTIDGLFAVWNSTQGPFLNESQYGLFKVVFDAQDTTFYGYQRLNISYYIDDGSWFNDTSFYVYVDAYPPNYTLNVSDYVNNTYSFNLSYALLDYAPYSAKFYFIYNNTTTYNYLEDNFTFFELLFYGNESNYTSDMLSACALNYSNTLKYVSCVYDSTNNYVYVYSTLYNETHNLGDGMAVYYMNGSLVSGYVFGKGFINLSNISIFTPKYFIYNGSEFNGATLDNISKADASILFFKPLYVSNYSLLGYYYDVVGNENASSLKVYVNYTYTHDLNVSIINPSNSTPLLLGANDVYVDVYDSYNNASCNISVNGTIVDYLSNIVSGTYSFSYDFSSEDWYNVSVYCRDDYLLESYDEIIYAVVNTSDIRVSLINFTPNDYGLGSNLTFEINVSNYAPGDAIDVNVSIKLCRDSLCNDVINETFVMVNISSNNETNLSYWYVFYDVNDVYLNVYANVSGDYNSSDNYFMRLFSPSLNITTNLTSYTLDPGDYEFVYLEVIHYEGDAIAYLDGNSIRLYDLWSRKSSYNVSDAIVVDNYNNGSYVLKLVAENLTSSNYYKQGSHTIYYEVLLSNYSITNISSTYYLKAPYVDVYLSTPSSITEGSTASYTVYVKNIGDYDISDVVVKVATDDSSVVAFDGTTNSYTYCRYSSTVLVNQEVTLSCDNSALKGASQGTANVYVIDSSSTYVSEYMPSITLYFAESDSKSIEVVAATTTEDTTTTSDSTYIPTEEEEEIQNLTTNTEEGVSFYIELPLDSISLEINGSKNITYYVINNGTEYVDLTLYAHYLSALFEVNLSPQTLSLSPGDNKSVSAEIKIVGSSIGEYEIKFLASYGEQVASDILKVIVNPDDAKKQEILSLYDKLKQVYEESKDDLPEGIRTQLESYLTMIEESLDQQDYLKAYSLIQSAAEIMDSVQDTQQTSGGSSILKTLLIILGIVFIVGMGVLIYYLWTPSTTTYNPNKGYNYAPVIAQQQRKEYMEKLKQSLNRKLSSNNSGGNSK